MKLIAECIMTAINEAARSVWMNVVGASYTERETNEARKKEWANAEWANNQQIIINEINLNGIQFNEICGFNLASLLDSWNEVWFKKLNQLQFQ